MEAVLQPFGCLLEALGSVWEPSWSWLRASAAAEEALWGVLVTLEVDNTILSADFKDFGKVLGPKIKEKLFRIAAESRIVFGIDL